MPVAGEYTVKRAQGFTLIELMIVIAIIGILTSIAIPKFADLIRKSHEGATKGGLGTLRSALSIYYSENEGLFPTVEDPTDILTMESGKYLKEIPSCNCPPYHQKMTTFAAGADSTTESGTPGAWGYQEIRVPPVGQKQWGDVWVNCTHTDTKSLSWNSY